MQYSGSGIMFWSKKVKQKNGVNISLIGGNTYVKCMGNYRSSDRAGYHDLEKG